MLIKIASAIGLLHLVAGLTIRGPNDGSPVPAMTMTVTTTLTVTVSATTCLPPPSITPGAGNPPAVVKPNAPGAPDPAGPVAPAIALTPVTTPASTPIATPTPTSVITPTQNPPTTLVATTPAQTPAPPTTPIAGPSPAAALPLIYIYPDTGISIANIRPFFPSNNSFGTTTSFSKSADSAGSLYITTLGTANTPSGAINVWPFVWTVSYAAASGGAATTRVLGYACTVNMRDRNAQSKVDVKLQFTPTDVIMSPQDEILVDCSAPSAQSSVTSVNTTTSSSSAAPAPTAEAYPLIYIYPDPGVTVSNVRPFYASNNSFGTVTSFSKSAGGSGPEYLTTLGMARGPDDVVNTGPVDLKITYYADATTIAAVTYFRLVMRADGQQQQGDVKLWLTSGHQALVSPFGQFVWHAQSSPFSTP